jgi:hypothetical protein
VGGFNRSRTHPPARPLPDLALLAIKSAGKAGARPRPDAQPFARRHHRPNRLASSASTMNGVSATTRRNHTVHVQRRGTESARKDAMPGSCCASSPPLVTTPRLLPVAAMVAASSRPTVGCRPRSGGLRAEAGLRRA